MSTGMLFEAEVQVSAWPLSTHRKVPCWYRYVNHYGHIMLEELPVLKETEKGVWLDDFDGKRFVLAQARKRYACPTVAEAKESFIARKKRQISILSRQLEAVKAVLRTTERDL